jgi:NTE family protein
MLWALLDPAWFCRTFIDNMAVTQENVPERFALVLGGGGLKGFSHIGVLRALEERGLRPAVICGTSIGSLIGAAYLGGMSIDEMEARAIALTQRDLFRLDHMGMLARRLRNRSLYLEAPLRKLVDAVVPKRPFDTLPVPLLVNTVDIERGAQVVWGLPGMRDVSIADAVYASCALPGFFPPARINDRLCVDGSVMDNLPVDIAAKDTSAVIAVDVGSTSIAISRQLQRRGFAAIYIRAAQIMMHSLEAEQLARWGRPPMLLVRPPIWQYNWFTFTRTKEMITAGYTATHETLDRAGADWIQGRGLYPRRTIDITVDRAACIGCGLCAVLAPHVMRMDGDGKAEVIKSPLEWSRAEGDFVHQCPTDAIHVTAIEGDIRRPSVQLESVEDGDEITE